jgi:hypothetical protein
LNSSTNHNYSWRSSGFFFRFGWCTQGCGFDTYSNLRWNSFFYWIVLRIYLFIFPFYVQCDLMYCTGVTFLKHSVFLFSLSHNLLLIVSKPFPRAQYSNLFVLVIVFFSRHPHSIYLLLILSTLRPSSGHPLVPLCAWRRLAIKLHIHNILVAK